MKQMSLDTVARWPLPPSFFLAFITVQKNCVVLEVGGKGRISICEEAPPCTQYVCTNMSQWRARGERGGEGGKDKKTLCGKARCINLFLRRKEKGRLSFPSRLSSSSSLGNRIGCWGGGHPCQGQSQ